VLHAKIIVLNVEVKEGEDELILDPAKVNKKKKSRCGKGGMRDEYATWGGG
jgi:hypothetical protein